MSNSVVASSILLALPIKSSNRYQREFTAQAAYAGGAKCAPVRGKIVPLDLGTLAAVHELASKGRLPLADSAETIRSHDDLFRDLVIAAEDRGLKPRSRDDQLFFIAVKTDAGEVLADGGRVDDALPRLAARVSFLELSRVSAFSVDELLIGVRARAAEVGVKLPMRLTLSKNHPEHTEWIKSIRERRRLADERWDKAQAGRGKRQEQRR